ncbi:ankyrin repeat-containing protein At5g02620-like isoform X4 [Fagus crenata]
MDAGLFNAVISGNVSFFEGTGGVGLNLGQVTVGKNSILHVAAKSGKVQIMEKVLQLQPSLLCMTNRKGNTALHFAASLGHSDMTMLLTTCANDQESAVKELLLRTQNQEKNTALHDAVSNGHYDVVDLLIKEDPGLTSLTNNAGESPLFLAVDRGFYKIALRILEVAPNCSYVGRKSMNVLHAAVIRTKRSKYLNPLHLKPFSILFGN